MHNVEIRIFPIASTKVDDAKVREWLDSIGATGMPWPQPDQDLTSAEAVIGLAAKRCYKSFEVGLNPNVTKIRKDWTEYLDNILKVRHGSVASHASYTYAIEGVSRVLTGELNRHVVGVKVNGVSDDEVLPDAISEGSMRYIRFTDIPWWIPTSLRAQPEDDPETTRKKEETLSAFRRVFLCVQDEYTRLVQMWDIDGTSSFPLKKQITSCVRRIIPMGVATGGVYTFNIRSLRHLVELRTSPAAEEEIFLVCGLIGKHMSQVEPRLFADFTQSPEGYWVPKYHKV